MLLAAMLAMVLAAAAPAFAQATVGDDDNGDNVQYVDCSQVQAAVQAQYGDANAAADDESIAAAAIDQGLTQNQVNACIGGIDDSNIAQGDDNVGAGDVVDLGNGGGGSVVASVDGGGSVAAGSDDGGSSASAASDSSSSATSSSTTELPETGGASLLALGAGALLVAGGLLARRIVR